jgi:hypothetical protein
LSPEAANDIAVYHKSIFNPRLLGQTLKESGFKSFKEIEIKNHSFSIKGFEAKNLHWSSVAIIAYK